MDKAPKPKQGGQQIPEGAEILVRNLERRKRLLSRISEQKESDIPDMVVKDTLLKFLDKEYARKGQESPAEGKERLADINRRVFVLLNRAASLGGKRQDSSPVTAMYATQHKKARRLRENPLASFIQETKDIIGLCREYKVSLKSITGMQHGLGVPKIEELERLLGWLTDKKIDFKGYAKTRTSMGIPKTLEDFLQTI